MVTEAVAVAEEMAVGADEATAEDAAVTAGEEVAVPTGPVASELGASANWSRCRCMLLRSLWVIFRYIGVVIFLGLCLLGLHCRTLSILVLFTRPN